MSIFSSIGTALKKVNAAANKVVASKAFQAVNGPLQQLQTGFVNQFVPGLGTQLQNVLNEANQAFSGGSGPYVSEPQYLPASQQFSTGQIKDWGSAALGGALDGLTGKYLETDPGKRAVNQGALNFLKDNIQWVCLGAVGLGALIYMAIFNRKR
jgi:hypothetical protein